MHARESAQVSSGIRELLDSWTTVPALVRDERLMVIASNRMARALSRSFEPGTDLARFTFTEPTVLAVSNWREVYGQVATAMRTLAQRHDAHDYYEELSGQLAENNEHFSALWHEQSGQAASTDVLFDHPVVGPFTASYRAVELEGREGHTLISWHATPSARSRDALRRLVALAAVSE